MARTFTLSLKGGERLKRKLHQTAQRLGAGQVLNVGFLASAIYPDGLNVAQNAFWQNFGTKNMPPRPFMQKAIDDNSPKWGETMGKLAKATNYDGAKVLALMGEGIKGQIVQAIVELTDPPLSPYTVERKGFDKPLIDTGVMQRSVSYEVVNK